MNLWLRLLATIWAAWRGAPLVPPGDVSRMNFRVWPHDLDVSLHMNNGRYLGIMDLGRLDLILRSGLWRSVLRHRWTPVLDGAIIRYRRELRAFKPFRLETRILAWTGATLLIEQRMLSQNRDGAEVLNAIAIHRAALYDRRAKAYVTIDRLMREIGIEATSPELPDHVAAFLAAEDALRRAG
ncbi:thioesterase family protein [Enterovirga rhinocerotis]|uniref:Thioesterase superfamily protein n=1 Tax=Enterovirga rhinocerotis TaxID=1339210 RepID=A0A4R7BR29_9HYPH|nr:thioesterase family protein [Enterovirga rhinocerotis]TDR87232.1 thioesterase superfamily protein [Enterovirga rhinocerotis]